MKQTALLSLLALLPAAPALAQNVGINTTAPALQLDVVGSTNPPYTSLGLRNSTGNGAWDHLYFLHDGSTAFMRAGGAETGLALQVGTGASGSYGGQTYAQVMQLLPTGLVGIGTTGPTQLLELGGRDSPTLLLHSTANNVVSGATLQFRESALTYGWNLRHNSGATEGSAANDRLVLERVQNGTVLNTMTWNQENGNVGIGTSTPSAALEIIGSQRLSDDLTVDAAGANTGSANHIIRFGVPGTTEGLGSKRSSGGNQYGLDFYTNATPRLSVTNAGRVGIGTTAPDRPLTVQGTGTSNELLSLKDNAGTTQFHVNFNNGGLNFAETNVADYRLYVQAGSGVGINTGTPATSAALEVSSTTQGVLLPRLTTTQMNAVAAPVPGLMIYNTTANRFYGYELSGTTTNITQNSFDSNFTGSSAYPYAQSFAATINGFLQAFSVDIYTGGAAQSNAPFTLSIYAGTGTSGQLLTTFTQSVTVPATYSATPTTTFTLPNVVPVTAGQVYTFVFQRTDGTDYYVVARSGNPYAGGILVFSPTYDLQFQVVQAAGQWVVLN